MKSFHFIRRKQIMAIFSYFKSEPIHNFFFLCVYFFWPKALISEKKIQSTNFLLFLFLFLGYQLFTQYYCITGYRQLKAMRNSITLVISYAGDINNNGFDYKYNIIYIYMYTHWGVKLFVFCDVGNRTVCSFYFEKPPRPNFQLFFHEVLL